MVHHFGRSDLDRCERNSGVFWCRMLRCRDAGERVEDESLL